MLQADVLAYIIIFMRNDISTGVGLSVYSGTSHSFSATAEFLVLLLVYRLYRYLAASHAE